MDEDTLLRLNLFFGWTQCHSNAECKLPSSQICHYVNLGYRGRYSLWEKRTHNQYRSKWIVLYRDMHLLQGCDLGVDVLFFSPAHQHLWKTNDDTLAKGLMLICWDRSCGSFFTLVLLLVEEMPDQLGFFDMKPYCKHGRFSISTGLPDFFHQWHHWRRGGSTVDTDTSVVTTCPVQPVSLLAKGKPWKGQNFRKIISFQKWPKQLSLVKCTCRKRHG